MIEVVQPGIQSSIQDTRPRCGLEQGVPQGGAADSHAAQLANIILGQEPHLPVLEITSSAFVVRFSKKTRISITGGGMIWHISSGDDTPSRQHLSDTGDHDILHLGSWRAHIIPPGTTLTGRPTRPGFRTYLGIDSGFQSQTWLQSNSTELRLHAGGSLQALKKGDILHPNTEFTTKTRSNTHRKWHLSRDFTTYLHQNEIRIYPAPETHWFPESTLHTFTTRSWSISRDSNRMGLRLESAPTDNQPTPIQNLISTVVLPGTIQMTPSGPILLGPDAQTSGGYPRIAQVCQCDLRTLAQKSPGAEIRFRWITLDDAIALRDTYHTEIRQLQSSIQLLQ